MAKYPCDKPQFYTSNTDVVIGMWEGKKLYRRFINAPFTHTSSSTKQVYTIDNLPSDAKQVVGAKLGVSNPTDGLYYQPIPYFHTDTNNMNYGIGAGGEVYVQVLVEVDIANRNMIGYVDYVKA